MATVGADPATSFSASCCHRWVGVADRFAGNSLRVRDVSLVNQSVSRFTARLTHPTGFACSCPSQDSNLSQTIISQWNTGPGLPFRSYPHNCRNRLTTYGSPESSDTRGRFASHVSLPKFDRGRRQSPTWLITAIQCPARMKIASCKVFLERELYLPED